MTSDKRDNVGNGNGNVWIMAQAYHNGRWDAVSGARARRELTGVNRWSSLI